MADTLPDTVESVAVVGAGTMGYGIGFAYALGGLDVVLYDVEEDALVEAQKNIDSALKSFVTKGRLKENEATEVADKIDYQTALDSAVADVDLVTEAVSEKMDVKQSIFEDLDEYTAKDTILATNTSGLSITEIASAVDDPNRVVGTHWFNPAHIVPLVEVIHGEQTDEEVAMLVYDTLEDLEKTPVEVKKDVPGFIGNRIQMAMCYEAFSLLDRGVASAEDIDRAVEAGFGFRLPALGIFEKVDQSGLDVHYDVESYLMPELDRGTEPNPVVSKLVEEGNLGLKTGRGVYDWDDIDPTEVYEDRDDRLLDLLETYESMETDLPPSQG